MSDALTKLHTAMLDTREGYAAAARDAEDAKLERLFRDMIEMRERHHAEVHAALAARGDEPDDKSSLMATVHKVAVDVRSAVTGLDRSALKPFVSGEEQLVEAYDRAIAEADAPLAGVLQKQKAELLAHIETMRALEA